MKKLSAIMLVAHDGQDFDYYFYGDPRVIDSRGNITVAGKKGKQVKIEFTLVAGAGVDNVRFLSGQNSIRVGPKGSACTDSPTSAGEFHNEQRKSDNVATIEDKKTISGDGKYPYALHFEADFGGGKWVADYCDPMFINS